jgi:hypothetical protein
MNENNDTPFLSSIQELKAHFDKKRSDLTPDAVVSIDEAIESLVESVRELHEQRDRLDRIGAGIEGIGQALPENVIPLRRPRLVVNPELAEQNSKRYILKLDCLIESRHISEIHKMAMELHSQSRRYAFLEYRDLDKATRQSLPALLNLGAITIFVPSILDLTMGEQGTLLSLVQQQSLNRPLLMVGSTQPFAELRGEAGVNLDLLAYLSRAYIKLSRPFSEYKDQGLIHYFLDTLSENPT